ncbi:MAG: hypothetical protein K9H64_22485 [Bacteroidales bacterium]|nr:hypothetical protein [Bacteroidales bacterium]MCF8458809.1 hypothetical protein [Bacteroidales bacterium]
MATIYYKGKVLALVPQKADKNPFITLYWQSTDNGVQKIEIIRISKAKFFASEFSTGYTVLTDLLSVPEMKPLINGLMETEQDLSCLFSCLADEIKKSNYRNQTLRDGNI